MSEPTKSSDVSADDVDAWSGTNLWDFSVAVYEREPVQNVCLTLQDSVGADVNLILYCLWLGVSGRGQIDADTFAYLSEAVSVWHKQVIVPLRGVRRQLREPPARVSPSMASTLRTQVKESELLAERIELDVLSEALDRSPVAHDIARRKRDMKTSLVGYLGFLGAAESEAMSDAIATLVACSTSA